jgi:glycerol kinase
MPAGLILAIDQGTTNTKGLLVDATGGPVFRTSSPVPLVTRPNGFVEQDPIALWTSVLSVMADAHRYATQVRSTIGAVAISNQRETALAWHAETGRPAAPAISWQCGRGAAICDRHADRAADIRATTGLPLAPLISASKWAWLLETEPAVREFDANGTLRLGTVDTWLIHQLTGGAVHATDLTNASRTGLLSLDTLAWRAPLLELFGIPQRALAALHCSSGVFGRCTAVSGFEHVPILAAIGDSQAALVGQGSFCPGTVKATYGTGSSLMALTGDLTADTPSLARTIAWSTGGKPQFALEGNVAMTGSAIQWLGEFLRLPNAAADVAALAATVPDADGVYFVPAMVGLGAPHWDADARGAVSGLSRAHTSAHLARASLEAVAYQVADVFFAMEQQSGLQFSELRADGGATRNASLMQFQADILGRPVLRSTTEELSAIGAAWLAGVQLGWWPSMKDLEALRPGADRFEPRMQPLTRNRLYGGSQRAVSSARSTQEVRA